jgi:hypothetical protein
MAWTQADLDELNKAYALGATEVGLPDRTVRFRSLSELRQIISAVEAQLGIGRRTRAIRFQTDKGIP